MHNVDQFQKEKDAVKLKVREDQLRIRLELQKQMD
jgi:aspartate beta-hydroxylase